jgi:hypothetical protein
MDDATTPPSTASALLASAGRARATRVLTGTWWALTGLIALVAYGATAAEAGVIAPFTGALFIGGMCVVAVVARNASAEAREPGSVRRGSVLRAAMFGVVVHGGLLAAVTVFGSSPIVTVLWVVVGGAAVVVTRPTTMLALGATTPLPARTPGPQQLSVPQIVAELRASAEHVRATTDPAAKAALAERRGELIELLAERDPDALALLLDDSAVRPQAGEGPDGPLPV